MSASVGIGYDSHRFGEDRPLIIGGVEIDYDRGLIGHSDADVLTHAVIDAILGAAGMEDIGAIFPDSDPTWQGRIRSRCCARSSACSMAGSRTSTRP